MTADSAEPVLDRFVRAYQDYKRALELAVSAGELQRRLADAQRAYSRSYLDAIVPPEVREQIVGLAEVREVFHSPKFGNVAGCMVVDGYVRRSNPIRVLRNNVVIYEGQLESLRRFKDDVNEVRAGTECGIGVRNYNDVKPGDQIECFERTEIVRKL